MSVTGTALDVSVVLGVHAHPERLLVTLESLRQQRGISNWECLIVANGGFRPDQHCANLIQSEPRYRLLTVKQPGLTTALAFGCDQARGALIARLDVGDEMAPNRLQRQQQAFSEHPDLVLATSDVEICGPAWEYLRTDSQDAATGQPLRVDTVPAGHGIAIDIPHHASVTFRRDAYQAVGGYRSNFYFGQDWDLWYRLSSQGTFVHDPEVLTRVRLFTDGLSSRHWREQRAIAELSLACHVARQAGESEALLLEKAGAIRPRPRTRLKISWDGRRAEGAYFIGEALRRNRDPRCRHYFREAIKYGFWKPRVWVRTLQSLAAIRMNLKFALVGELRINVGCGRSPTSGFLNYDSSPSVFCGQSLILSWLAIRVFGALLTQDQIAFIRFARSSRIVFADATRGLPLPPKSCCVVYASHVIEHLTVNEAISFLREAFRVLAPGGVLRLAVPDLQVYIDKYNANHDAPQFIANLNPLPSPRSNRFKRFASALVGDRTLHKVVYNASSLSALLSQLGFAQPVKLASGDTTICDPGALNLRERDWESLYMEAMKPLSRS